MAMAQQPPAAGGAAGGRGGRGAPPIQPKAEELAQIRAKSEQIEGIVKQLKAKHADPDLVGDVEVYAKAGRYLLEYPELFGTQNAIDHSLVVLDQGIARAKQLSDGASPWNTGKKQVHAYYSEIDGSVQPYAITLPESYDPAKPARLYVWLHGRQNNTTESEFIFSQQTFRPGNVPVADQGQIQLDLFGRINGAGWHWAGEADVFEGIAAVKKRFKIDDQRVMLRGFSMGGEGAWHIALHYPGSLRGGRDRRRDLVAPRADAGTRAVSVRDAEDLGKHGGVGAERLQSAAGRPRWRYRYADRVAARAAARHAQSRAVGVFAAHARPVGEGGLPVRRRAGFPASEGHSGHLPDLAEYGTRHQPAGPPAAGRLSEGVGRQGPDLAGAHSLRHLHDALQPRLLGLGGRPGKALRARRHRRAARCRAATSTRSRRTTCRACRCARPNTPSRSRSTARR